MREVSQSPPIVDQYFMECLKGLSDEHNAAIKLFTIRAAVVSLVFLMHCFVSPPT
jgi:hypothetical protein